MAFAVTPTCGATTVDDAFVYVGNMMSLSTYGSDSSTWCETVGTVPEAASLGSIQTYSAVLYSTAGGDISILVEAGFFMKALSFGVAALLLAFY